MTSPGQEPPGLADRAERWIPWILGVVVFGSLAALVHPWYDPTTDGSIYILTSRAMLEGEGYTLFGIPFQARPPGYSLLIAPILEFADSSFYGLNFLTSLFGALAMVLFFFLRRGKLGAPVAALLALALWTEPEVQRLCNRVMSDMPGLALLFTCFVVERWADRQPSARRDAVLALVIAAGACVRTVLILALPAILLARWLRADPVRPWHARLFGCARRQVVLVAVCVLAMLPWNLSSAHAKPPLPLDQFEVYSYATGMLHTSVSDPSSPLLGAGQILARIPENLPRILSVLGSRMQESAGQPFHLAVGAVLLVCGLALAFRRRSSEDFFFLALLLVLLTFYEFTTRTVLPLFVLSLGSAVELAASLGERWIGPRGIRVALVLALGALCVHDFRPQAGWGRIRERHRKYLEIARMAEREIPAGETLASGLGGHLAVYLERPVYSMHWARRNDPSPASLQRMLQRYGVDRVLLTTFEPTDQEFLADFGARSPGAELSPWARTFPAH